MNTEFNADADRDPDRLAREIDEQRREINETLRALEEKFSSREIANQFMQYIGEPGREWVGTLSGSVKANPLPTLLTAIGVSWLMMSDRRGANSPAHYGDYASSGDEYGRSRFRDAADSARDATGAVMRKAHELGDRAEHAGEALGEKAAHARESLHSHAAHARDALRSHASQARDGLQHAREGLHHAADLRYNVAHVIKEQPLALGAIGIAIGALLGAALPRTQPERRVLGEASERVMKKGKEMAREGFETASRKVEEVVEAAEETLHGASESTEGDLGEASLSDLQPASSTSQGPRAPVPGGPGLG